MIQALWSLDQQFQNKNGSILTHGKIYVYYSGRTALATTYSDEDGNVVNPNPIILDNNGRAACFASSMYAYTVVVCDAYGKELFSYDITLHDAVATAEKVFVIGTDGTVQVDTTTLPNGVQYDLSVNTDIIATNELVENVSANIQDQLDNKKDLQEEKSYSGSQTKTITNISQDENGVITVTYEDIDLPPEVPNVEITSPNGTIDVQSTTDVQTNTKTFTIDVNATDAKFWQGYASEFTLDQAHNTQHLRTLLHKSRGQGIDPITGLIPGLYLVTASFYVRARDVSNDLLQYNYIFQQDTGVHEHDCSIPRDSKNNPYDYDTVEISQLIWISSQDVNSQYFYFSLNFPYTSGASTNQLIFHNTNFAFYKIEGLINSYSGGGGGSYTAGTGIDITNDVISADIEKTTKTDTIVKPNFGQSTPVVKEVNVNDGYQVEVGRTYITIPSLSAGPGIELTNLESPDTGKAISVKVGEGLMIDPVSGVVMIDTEVGDVVETVEKLKKDLDTQITTNFDMPNISQVYDFADPSVSTLANGACMLCQSFTIPINHELRTTTDDPSTPTLFGIYAQQNFAHKIMLALYEYTYAAEGEEHGSSTYVGDTGPVNVAQGVNEFPLKNRNPSITELRSDKVYYATLYLPNDARVNGLLLAGAPNYGNASIPAEPRLSCAVENITWDGQELDMNDPTTTLNHYQEVIIPGQPVYYQYYIGPWQSGYNERWSAPRFYMQIRNGEYNVPVVPTEPFNDLGDTKLPMGTADQSNIPSFQPSQANSAFRDVTPLLNVTITAFEWIDGMSTAGGWAAANCVFDSGFANNLSGVSNTVTDLGQVVSGEYPGYAHRITFTTPITLTAGTTYRFLCGCTNGSPYFKVWLDPTDVIHVGNNGWYVVDTNVLRIDHQMGMYNKLYDNNSNHYVI